MCRVTWHLWDLRLVHADREAARGRTINHCTLWGDQTFFSTRSLPLFLGFLSHIQTSIFYYKCWNEKVNGRGLRDYFSILQDCYFVGKYFVNLTVFLCKNELQYHHCLTSCSVPSKKFYLTIFVSFSPAKIISLFLPTVVDWPRGSSEQCCLLSLASPPCVWLLG